MKLFTKDIDKKLFAQFPKGGDLANQKVIAKIFNPYGRGVWYIINSDPNDPDYLWAIINLFEVEVGSVSRKELESLRIKPFMLPLERDLSFSERNALEVYKGVQEGERYEDGGRLSDSTYLVQMAEEYAENKYEKPVKKGEGITKAKKDGERLDYSEVTVYFKDGSSETFYRDEFEEFFDTDEYAKGGFTPNIVSKNNRKFDTTMYYERFEDAIGSFAWTYEGKYNEGILYPLSDFDKKYYSHLKLKDGEILLRYKTERMISSSGKYLIKMNIDKGLVYFLDDSNEDDDKNPTFESRGIKLEYLAIDETYFDLDMFAKGGLTFDEKVKAVKKSLMSRDVPKNYRNLYGKKYDKDEAEESAKKIIGAQVKKYNKK